MPIFDVQVVRTGYGSKTLKIDAVNGGEAALQALLVAGDESFSEHSSDYTVESVVTMDGHSVQYEEKPTESSGPETLVWFAVTGRIPGDDEDSTYIYKLPKNTDQQALFNLFEADIYEDESESEEEKESNFAEFGNTVFINSVLLSETEIQIIE